MKEKDFEIGRWYLRDTGTYCKLKEIRDNIFIASEAVQFGTNYKNIEARYGDITIDNNTYTLVEDLSVIADKLPDGHPDLKKYLP